MNFGKTNKTLMSACLCVVFLFSTAFSKGDSSVMLQGFHWTSWKTYPWWNIIKEKSDEMAQAGIDIVWLPPSSDSLAEEGYLPRKLYVQNSKYGTIDQLMAAVGSLHAKGIKVIADVIINHRVGTKDWADFTEPQWGPDSVCSDDEWGKGQGVPDTGKGFHAGRDIDHTKAYVQDSIKEWMNWMRNQINYDGWRYDYGRGFSTEYFLKYNRTTSPAFSVAEVWDDFDINNPDAHRRQMVEWMNSTNGEIKNFDFTTKAILQHVVSTGEYWRLKDNYNKPSGLIGWWPQNAVTFVDNHDTGPSMGSKLKPNAWPFPSDKIMQGYAYILTHPGIPCIYWLHFFDWGFKNEISRLVNLRKSVGIGATSDVNIVKAATNIYAAIIDGKLAVKIGKEYWDPGSEWKQAVSGNGYHVWIKK